MKRPAFQFYPADWRKDAELQSCSIAARGLWHEMLCIMHECDPYGEFRINGKPATSAQMARVVGMSVPEFEVALAELEDAGVPSRTADGAVYSRRMKKDEQNRADWRDRKSKSRDCPADVPPDVTPVSRDCPAALLSSSSSSKKEDTPSLRSGGVREARKPEIPDWIPPEPWAAFVEMRRKIRAPLTDRAVLLTIAELKKMRETEDIGAVLDQSVRNSWRGVFAVKRDGSSTSRASPTVKNSNASASDWWGRWRAVAEKRCEWQPEWGPKFGEPECKIPPDVQAAIKNAIERFIPVRLDAKSA